MDHLDELRAQGFTLLDPLTAEQVAETNAFLLSRPVYVDAHVPQTSRNARGADVTVPREQAAASECVCVATADAIVAPHVFELGLAATALAGAYLGRDPPVAYSANAFWTRAGAGGTRPDIQEFHRDTDDERFLAMFVYLTDVSGEDGGPQDLHGPDDVVRTIFGPAGTVFLADTSRLHRGRKPAAGERGIAWYRWGVSDRPPAGVWDKVEPVPAAALGVRYPADPWLQESAKLLVTPP